MRYIPLRRAKRLFRSCLQNTFSKSHDCGIFYNLSRTVIELSAVRKAIGMTRNGRTTENLRPSELALWRCNEATALPRGAWRGSGLAALSGNGGDRTRRGTFSPSAD